MVYDLTMNIWRRNGRLTGAGRLCQREIAHQVYCEPLPLFRASTAGLPSRSARFITSISSISRGRQAEKAQNILSAFISTPWARKALPAGSEDVIDNTSSPAVHSRQPPITANSVSSLPQQRLDPSRGGGRWSPQFSREKGTTESGAFSHRKNAHNECTPFPREQSARALRPNT